MKDIEHNEQAALILWARLQPLPVSWIFAIPNGGARSKRTAGRMKAEGVLAGVPDLCLPVSRRGYHALYIEMKSPKGRLSSVQKAMIKNLRDSGYAVEVARSWVEASQIIERYIRPERMVKSPNASAHTTKPDEA